MWGGGVNLTVKINSAAAGGVARFEASRENAKLVTSDAALDLSHSTVVSGFTVASSNATSTNFIVNDIETAFRITGGSGTDTVTAQGFVFSADQRYVIFITTSVERIIDTSGTYTIDNTSPNIASNGGGATAAISIAENSTAVTTITATDLNVGQTLSYSIIGGADAGKFAIGYTGALSFVTAPNFELPTDADGNNVYDVIVQASDGHGGIDTQAIAVTVTDVFENSAPTITSNGGGATAAISIVENTTSVTTVTATDPDVGQTLSYSIIGGADAGKFTIGATTGALSFVTAPNFELPTDAGGNNVYDVIVQASDGHGGIDTQAIAVGVQNVAGANILGTAGNDVIDMTHTVAGQPFPTTDGDIINGGAGSDTLAGGAGADTFVFDLTALTPAQPGSGVVDHILDYNQGNSGTFNPAEGDTFDFSALLSAGSGQPVGNLVRVLENPSGTAAILQIDQDGAANGAHWTTIAQLDGVHTGDGVKVIFDASQPAATLTAPALVPTHNFNGDGKADILWQHDSGLPAIWTMDGTNITGGAALPNPGPTWHVAEAADFNGDGKSDILWQNDSGLPAIWTMDGTNVTGWSRPAQSWAHLACRCSGRFQRRRQGRHSLAERQRLAGDLDHGRHQHHRRSRPAQSWAYVACRCGGRFQRRRQVRYSLAERQRLAGDLDHGRHQHHRWRRPARSWAYVACRCGGRFQRRRQVRYSLAERQRLAGDLDHGRHQHHRWQRPCPILGLRGMSLRRPISTATASPIFFGRTTAACRRSGPWTAPTSPVEPSCLILAATGTYSRAISLR